MKYSMLKIAVVLAGLMGSSMAFAISMKCPKNASKCEVSAEITECKGTIKRTQKDVILGTSVGAKLGVDGLTPTGSLTVKGETVISDSEEIQNRRCNTFTKKWSVTPGCTLKVGVDKKARYWHDQTCPATKGTPGKPAGWGNA